MVKRKGANRMSFKILVMSCDKYAKHTFELFHHCIEKYWKDHPEVIYNTETIDNPYYKTIHSNYPVKQWSIRLIESLKQIDSKIVLVCPDDTFLRKQVDNEVIEKLSTYIDDKLIAINLEPRFDGWEINEIFGVRDSRSKWLSSMMPQLWNKEKLIELIAYRELNPREVETLGTNSRFNFGIINSNKYFDFGKMGGVYPYAITEGKWAREIVGFCKNEGIEIDFNELGFFEK